MKTFTSIAFIAGLVASSVAQDMSDSSLPTANSSTSAADNSTIATLAPLAPDNAGGLNVTAAWISRVLSQIDFSAINCTAAALQDISSAVAATNTSSSGTNNTRKRTTPTYIDTHAHIVPPFYSILVPVSGGEQTPNWSPQAHLSFMASENIAYSILSVSAPGANVFLGNQAATVALASLLNLYSASISALNPKQFGWYAVVPLPYTAAAIAEAEFALDFLGADGLILYTNYEGLYLGDPLLAPFFTYLQSRTTKTIVFIHPTEPVLPTSFVDANPTTYKSGIIEYPIETARTLQDLSWTLAIVNYTQINWIAPNLGGAFTGIGDRMLKSIPQDDAIIEPVYHTRVFWDSAGPTYPGQIQGLLGYGIPTSQLVYGTEYPYAPFSTDYAADQASLLASGGIVGAANISNIMTNNAKGLFGL
ncbi:hypothetical protein FRB96_005683 [Tulasnella sp. 330]|nr:hypothetical protein FRB96_005683 [Tulasnella sp. 330]KAG8878261.1 hypothetical protein FRB97_002660 [Tulasnella sp. 331]KAG8883374.1 hypothetical protein FRB98_003146 [Tulasnella sp. 332]